MTKKFIKIGIDEDVYEKIKVQAKSMSMPMSSFMLFATCEKMQSFEIAERSITNFFEGTFDLAKMEGLYEGKKKR